MEPRFRFKDFVVIKEDVPFWGNIKGQIIDFETNGQDNIRPSYRYLVKIKKSNITKWFSEEDLVSRNEEVNPDLIGISYE